MNSWNIVKFGEIVDFSPKVKLPRNIALPFIDMEAISPKMRYVSNIYKKKFEGSSSKFENDDILFARITPCLENRKIAQAKIEGKGFGSTEFFILRAKENIMDQNFLYYFAKSDYIVNNAINSFVGASGRQRADEKFIKKIKVKIPSLTIQKKIAAILTAYDDLIENNNKRIAILEKMAGEIFREWFVRMRFPGYKQTKFIKGIPEGWELLKLGKILELLYGKALKEDMRKQGNIPVYGSGGIVGFHNEYLVNGPGIIIGRKGNVGSIFISYENFFPIDTVFYAKSEISIYFLFYLLKTVNFINNDAAVPGLNRAQALSVEIFMPDLKLIDKFEEIVVPIFSELQIIKTANDVLTKTRDMLLPRLLSGKLSVENLDIKFPPSMEE